MEAVAPHGTATAEEPVHALRDPDREALKSPREPACVHRLDEEMDVIALNGELEDP